VASCVLVLATVACDSGASMAVVDNRYERSSTDASNELTVYRARFMTAYFDAAVPPGSSSVPESTLFTSGDKAYALLAPGWDPTGDAGPKSLIVVESNAPMAAVPGGVVHIAVDDSTFRGRCDAGAPLTQEEANVITGAFFADIFGGTKYDATSCVTTVLSDSGAH
jgi:hypothetical protein